MTTVIQFGRMALSLLFLTAYCALSIHWVETTLYVFALTCFFKRIGVRFA
jgi:hypothetical protein